MESVFLRNNMIFWSRLGMHPLPSVYNDAGLPALYDEELSQLKLHQDFYNKGVRIHSFILHSGWMEDGVYDYRTTDRTMDAACEIGPDVLIIPRIMLDPPIDWCKNHPEHVFVYYDGPRDAEGIKALVGTPEHDYLGYEAPNGVYMGDPKYSRPNVGGKICRQSFSSDQWLNDAEIAFTKLIYHLEEKYGNKILGYHIAYGTSGETLMWGRISQKYGDYGIDNQRRFKKFLKERYNTEGELPPPDERYKNNSTLAGFMRADNKISRYYDEFTDEVNSYAVEYLCKVAKKVAPAKLTGVFYGYFMGISESGYTGHTNIQRLLDSPYVDFFSAPKTYYRCAPGDSCGEFCITQSVNLKKVWLDECDVRTHLVKTDEETSWLSKDMTQTVNVLTRELGKNLSHNSGFWFMDLGGNWYNSPEMMDLVGKLHDIHHEVTKKTHQSISDVLVIVDEKSTSVTGISHKCKRTYLTDFIYNLKRSGAIPDIFRYADVKSLDLRKYKLIVFAYTFALDSDMLSYVKENSDAVIMFNYAAGCLANGEFSLDNTKNVTGFSICEAPTATQFDFPGVKIIDEDNIFLETGDGNAALKTIDGKTYIMNTIPSLDIPSIKKIVKNAGCHIYCQADYTIYGDNRFLVITASDKAYVGDIDFGDVKNWVNTNTGEKGIGRTVSVNMEPYSSAVFIFE